MASAASSHPHRNPSRSTADQCPSTTAVLESEDATDDEELGPILAEAKVAIKDHRDHALTLGRLCSEFILKRLRRGLSAHGSRVLLSDRIAKAVGYKMDTSRLIGYWQVVRLFGKGDPGPLPILSIKWFMPLLKHEQKAAQWHILPDLEKEARAVWKEACENRWSARTIRQRIAEHCGGKCKFKGRSQAVGVGIEDSSNPLKQVILADPRDAADLIARLITGHPQRERLLEELRKTVRL